MLETDQKSVASVEADLVRTLALDDKLLGAVFERRDRDPQVQLESKRQRVEAGTEIRRGRWCLDGHRRIAQAGPAQAFTNPGPRAVRRPSPAPPSAAAPFAWLCRDP